MSKPASIVRCNGCGGLKMLETKTGAERVVML